MPTTPAPVDGRSTRWEAHRLARRDELVDAALRAIARLGPDVAMDDIAAAAGTSKTVLYRHFADKDQLHRAVAARVDRRVVSSLRAAVLGASGSRQALAAAITAYLHLVRDDPHVYRFVVRVPATAAGGADPVSGLTDAIGAELARLIALRLAPGAPPPEQERVLARVAPWGHGLVGLVRAAADAWSAQPQRVDADALAAQLTSLVWDGLGPALDAAGAGPDPLAGGHRTPAVTAPSPPPPSTAPEEQP